MIVLVTGASRGIGKAIAQSLAKNENKVIANYNKSEEQAKLLEKEFNNIEIYRADVSKREEVHNMIQDIIGKYGRIDVLINNAGISQEKMFSDVTDEDWNNMINTNLYSAFCTIQEVLPYMIAQKNGSIINISSIWGIVGASCESIYSVSKAGIDAITKSLAKELGPSGIRVNSIAPGIIDTDMNKNLKQQEINDIKKYCTHCDDVFTLIDKLFEKNKDGILLELKSLLLKRHPLEILAVLQSTVSNYLVIKNYQNKLSNFEISKKVGIHEYRVKLAVDKMKNISLRDLTNLKLGLIKAEESIKEGKLNENLALEIVLLNF